MLLERGAMGGDHRIAGPERLTGDELAARVSEGLGRPVIYRGQPLDQFEREVDAVMGVGTGRRVASKFHYFAAHPEDADMILSTPFQQQVGLEGFIPTNVKSWVRAHREDFSRAG